MNAWRMVVVSTALISVFAIAECQQQPQQPEQGMCFQGIHCSGSALRLLPTWTECKAAGGKSWLSGAANYCTSFGVL
jgi:hypothetical protein